MKRVACISIVAACFAIGCSGSSKVSIVGKSADEQAHEIADKVCEQSAECGLITISCGGAGEEFSCTGTIEPDDYQECYDELEPDIREDFERCDLTAAQEQRVEDCINALLGQSCVSQSELDAYVDEINAGNEPEWPRPFPTECAGIDDLFDC
jgi:hypothetical protein